MKLSNKIYDKIGIFVSSLCLIHCLATPILLLLGSAFLEHPLWHVLFFFMAGISVYLVIKNTKPKWFTKLIFLIGLGVFLFGEIEHIWHKIQEENSSGWHWMAVIGSLVLIIGHLKNQNDLNSCPV